MMRAIFVYHSTDRCARRDKTHNSINVWLMKESDACERQQGTKYHDGVGNTKNDEAAGCMEGERLKEVDVMTDNSPKMH